MDGIPFFIEVEEAKKEKDVALCTKISTLLFQQNIRPLPFAATLDEAKAVLAAIHQTGRSPAIFVINTFGAKEILANLDPLMQDTPALFLRRGMFAGKSGLMDTLAPDPSKLQTMAVVGKMTPRLTSFWVYGSKNSDHVASRASQALVRFLKSNDFRDIEVANKLQQT